MIEGAYDELAIIWEGMRAYGGYMDGEDIKNPYDYADDGRIFHKFQKIKLWNSGYSIAVYLIRQGCDKKVIKL